MPYLQLRITCDPSGSRTDDTVFSLLHRFVKKWVQPDVNTTSEFTCGYEELNKFGEPCAPHYHLNVYFDPPDLKDPLRSAKEWLKREAIARDFRLKGNKVWSCTLVDEPKDYLRWIRYPLKEKPMVTLVKVIDSVGNDFTQLVHDAQTERKRSIEINIIKREKLADKSSFRDKLFEHLDDSLLVDATPPDHKAIWITILKFYQSQKKSICFKTVSGYTISYQLQIGTLTPMECYSITEFECVRSNPM